MKQQQQRRRRQRRTVVLLLFWSYCCKASSGRAAATSSAVAFVPSLRQRIQCSTSSMDSSCSSNSLFLIAGMPPKPFTRNHPPLTERRVSKRKSPLLRSRTTVLAASSTNDNNREGQGDSDSSIKKSSKRKFKRNHKSKKGHHNKGPMSKTNVESKEKKKQQVAKVAAELRQQTKRQQSSTSPTTNVDDDKNKENTGILDMMLDPFEAGKKFRQTIDSALTITSSTSDRLSQERRSVYYVDDRLSLDASSSAAAPSQPSGAALFSERNPLLERMLMERDDRQQYYIPEVLVVGATGEVGRLVVKRLLLDGRFRVRVLVRNLYSKTLNLLGTGVTYCQGDLNNVESLEYALTDVDKIVFCAQSPRPDEADFEVKFQAFCKENLDNANLGQSKVVAAKVESSTKSDLEWEQLEKVLQVKAKLAEQVDCIGMQNLVRAYQNVRHADYGTSQAAKRSLFKFQDRPEDINLFSIDDESSGGGGGGGEEDEDGKGEKEKIDEEVSTDTHDVKRKAVQAAPTATYVDEYDHGDTDGGEYEDEYEDEFDQYADEYEEYDEDEYGDYDEEHGSATATTTRKGATVKTQCQWMRNKFEHGVFVGKVPRAKDGGLGGEAAIVSSRLRTREEPDKGIDLSNDFAGFVCRVCSDGGRYEAFVRSANYETDGIEYVCDFTTDTKQRKRGNKSRNKFTTVRLPFVNFKPVQSRGRSSGADETVVPPFKGRDVRQIGFRYRSENNPEKAKFEKGDLSNFYLAFSYIKVYRSQPEPEFVYLSDARIPPVVHSNMVRHDALQIVTNNGESQDERSFQLLDQAALTTVADNPMARCPEETYYKYRGEEILKGSGLSYTIVRICGFNELPSGEASTIDLRPTNDEMTAVSRAEVAQVCADALLDPNALNKSLYMTKAERKSNDLQREEDMSSKFALVPTDASR